MSRGRTGLVQLQFSNGYRNTMGRACSPYYLGRYAKSNGISESFRGVGVLSNGMLRTATRTALERLKEIEAHKNKRLCEKVRSLDGSRKGSDVHARSNSSWTLELPRT